MKSFIVEISKWTGIAAIIAGIVSVIAAVVNGSFDLNLFKSAFFIAATFLDGLIVTIFFYNWISEKWE